LSVSVKSEPVIQRTLYISTKIKLHNLRVCRKYRSIN